MVTQNGLVLVISPEVTLPTKRDRFYRVAVSCHASLRVLHARVRHKENLQSSTRRHAAVTTRSAEVIVWYGIVTWVSV